jgi:hypothetical protein
MFFEFQDQKPVSPFHDLAYWWTGFICHESVNICHLQSCENLLRLLSTKIPSTLFPISQKDAIGILIMDKDSRRQRNDRRQNIRKKLCLSSRKDHLVSHLLSLLK